MEDNCGTRSWKEADLRLGGKVYVPATYFDGKFCTYSNSLAFQQSSILQGTVISIDESVVQVRFAIDDQTATVSRNVIKINLSENEAQFLIKDLAEDDSGADALLDAVGEYEDDISDDDSIDDPTYEPTADLAQKNSDSKQFHHGEEVMLWHYKKHIFKATYDISIPGSTIHGKSINENEGRFIISKVFKEAVEWLEFESDMHVVGAFVKWDLRDVTKISNLTLDEINSSCSTVYEKATPLQERKRKRNPSKWKTAQRKKARSEGRAYEYITKTKEVKGRKERSIKQGCSDECKKLCNRKINQEERKKLFENFWSLETDSEKKIIFN